MSSPSVDVAPGTIVLFSDLICPFTHIAVHRLFVTRERLGLEDEVRIDHHAFPIELLNGSAGTRHGSDSEIPVLGPLEPDAGWQLWQGPDYQYPNTVLLAFEAVQAAKKQGLKASENLDRALRRAFWAESATIQIHATILAIAEAAGGVDAARLATDIAAGVGRSAVWADYETASTDAVSMSPHLFLADGSDFANPGIEVHWQGDWAKGFPVVDKDDADVYEQILLHAAQTSATVGG
jgi:predicted DsbA family dithiol-disulfide isomerase